MITRLLLSFSLVVAFANPPSFGADDTDALHGIRNKKCATSEEGAKFQVFEQLRQGKDLCAKGIHASQAEGWTCRKGGDCKKKLYRCNTQYRCAMEQQAATTTEISPAPMSPQYPEPTPSPVASPSFPTPTVMPTVAPSALPTAIPTAIAELVQKIMPSGVPTVAPAPSSAPIAVPVATPHPAETIQ